MAGVVSPRPVVAPLTPLSGSGVPGADVPASAVLLVVTSTGWVSGAPTGTGGPGASGVSPGPGSPGRPGTGGTGGPSAGSPGWAGDEGLAGGATVKQTRLLDSRWGTSAGGPKTKP